MRRLIVWGAGTLGGRVAGLWRQRGGAVVGLTRTRSRHAALRKIGVKPRLGAAMGLLEPDDVLLLALPGHKTQAEAVGMLVQSDTSPPARAVLFSTTGYYGPGTQGVISENTPQGEDKRAASIARTERAFRAWAGASGIVIRLGGLYGHGRGPMSALARRGAPLLRPPDKPMALIHYDDAAAATSAALGHPAPQSVYLAVTPPCPTRQEFYQLACRMLGLPEPEFAEPLGRPPATYDVARLRRDLLAEPTYPDWHAALEV